MLRCAKAGVRTPCVYLVDQPRSRIYMEKVEGNTLKHFLRGRYDAGTGRYDEVALATVVRSWVFVRGFGLWRVSGGEGGRSGCSWGAPEVIDLGFD